MLNLQFFLSLSPIFLLFIEVSKKDYISGKCDNLAYQGT